MYNKVKISVDLPQSMKFYTLSRNIDNFALYADIFLRARFYFVAQKCRYILQNDIASQHIDNLYQSGSKIKF